MKILVTGFAGQLGFDVVNEAKRQGLEAVGIDLSDLDLTDEQAVQTFFAQQHDFDAIIHCAAYTAVDNAEDNIKAAEKINVQATEYLVREAKKMQAKFMYISTEYVYDGLGDTPFTETSPTEPLSIYGKTKLAGEKVAETLMEHFIVRISWAFGVNGQNFIKTMLRLAETHDTLTVVDDQVGSPTYTYDLAKLLISMIQTDKYGLYQASNEGFCSWYEFAKEIFRLAELDVTVNPVDSSAYPTKAVRPKNSRMTKAKLVDAGFEPLPTWQDALARYLDAIK